MSHPLAPTSRLHGAPAACAAVCATGLAGPLDPLAWLETWRDGAHPWLLDSALARPRLGRWSFVGGDPWAVLRAWGRRLELECRRHVHPAHAPGRTRGSGDPLACVRALLRPRPARPSPDWLPELPFAGGAVGVLGYELAEQTEPVQLHARDDLGLPDLTLLLVDELVALDGERRRCFAVGLGFGASEAEARRRASEACARAAAREARAWDAARAAAAVAPCADPRRRALAAAPPAGLVASLDEADYKKAVAAVRDEIAAGNVYQANLCRRMEAPFAGDPLALYRTLRSVNPAPFAAYLELPDATVLSSSPERFLRLDGDGRVESRPIKGTRPRGADAAEDEALRRVLECSEKDRAENLMIVDLVRNDLGRVCRTGSVRVPELMSLEPYATVFQLVSAVTGRLREDADVLDLVRAAFPPGSMTGAPKIAALRLLDRLEPVRRGIYSGALGYLDARGGADLSVVIRALVLVGGRALCAVGGGIVADSDPEAEHRETLDKARALWAALG